MANNGSNRRAGPVKGDFIPPPETDERNDLTDELPRQDEFWRPPARFGSVPVEKEPLGWDRRRGFRKFFPQVMLPLQVAERVAFGHPELEPNRLFWGDNLHVMRQLPNESIDLIYIDPPFFSGRQYNVIYGDQNELRSFSDMWEEGMPGYLIWLNVRLFEMKRLLKRTGSIFIHCDWHASHYIKVEMDKIFGYANFVNEIVWTYGLGGSSKRTFSKKHDIILFYSKSDDYMFEKPSIPATSARMRGQNKGMLDVWSDIPSLNNMSKERIGYPTQKPEKLLERIIESCSMEEGTVADFFGGGGTTATVAQQLGRRWISCDQSRVAVALTADRLMQQVESRVGALLDVPDFTLEHWGIYEAQRLSGAPPDQFRAFVLRCFGARDEKREEGIHGYKGEIPVWVGAPDQGGAVTASDVQAFANAIRRTLRYKQDNLRDGVMLAWAFRPDATEAAERLRKLEETDLNFIRLDTVRVDSPRFREHVAALSTDHADYENFLTFVQPPRVEVGFRRVGKLTYDFDASDSVAMNPGAKIINVQWDFDYRERFTSTQGYSFVRGAKNKKEARYKFPSEGKRRIACRVQDNMGGDGIWTGEITAG